MKISTFVRVIGCFLIPAFRIHNILLKSLTQQDKTKSNMYQSQKVIANFDVMEELVNLAQYCMCLGVLYAVEIIIQDSLENLPFYTLMMTVINMYMFWFDGYQHVVQWVIGSVRVLMKVQKGVISSFIQVIQVFTGQQHDAQKTQQSYTTNVKEQIIENKQE
ncbi:Hypothetical_protein [Hexamita inflata]|uniref:Hypothetical_protein n=1 Tax=Hexamita inflata TaxID=28002 RepID=A0AA86N4G0_9EUKA|nr:Hypothetical protein HINF_LOCUS34 [Hexamita inflata]